MFHQRLKDAELSSITKVTCKHLTHSCYSRELDLFEMPWSRDGLNVCSHLRDCPSWEVLSTTSHPSHGGTRRSRQLHPVCAFGFPPSTLRNISKCTDRQACSMLKEDTRVPISLGFCTLLLKRSLKEDVCNNA